MMIEGRNFPNYFEKITKPVVHAADRLRGLLADKIPGIKLPRAVEITGRQDVIFPGPMACFNKMPASHQAIYPVQAGKIAHGLFVVSYCFICLTAHIFSNSSVLIFSFVKTTV